MKTVSGRALALILGVSILAFATNVFAGQLYTSVSAYAGSQDIKEGWVNVPGPANVEWEVDASGYAGSCTIVLGGDLNVNETASPGNYHYDVTTTAGGGTYYYLHAYTAYPDDYASGMIWIGW